MHVLHNNVVPDFSVHVSKAKVAATVLEGELLVVDTDQMQNGGPQFVDVGNLIDSMIAPESVIKIFSSCTICLVFS